MKDPHLPYTATGHCQLCGHHKDWGCRFDCPEKKPPAAGPLYIERYRAWADEQKLRYMREGMR